MVFLLVFVAIGLFIYFQQKTSNRNLDRFERTREKYEQLLEQLRKNKTRDEEQKIDE
jgi:hypothetical protein